MMAKSVETRKTIVKIGFALLLGIMFFVAYLSKTEPMAEPSSSYFNVLDLLLQQLRGEQPYQVIEGNMHGAVYPISLAYLGNIFGQTESYVICYYVQGGILALMVMLTTLFMGNLTGRFWIGVIAAVSICCFSYPYWIATLGYSYWGAPVTVLIVSPLLCDLFRNIRKENDKKSHIELLIVIIIMLIGNIIRQHASLPILCILMMYIILKQCLCLHKKQILRSVVGIAALLLLFVCTEPILHNVYDLCSGKLRIENVERPWHAIWCGLGYNSNDYGFEWNDSAAYKYVTSVDSKAEYCSEEYFDILKDRVMEVVYKDPFFVLGTYWEKFVDSLKIGWSCFGKILIKCCILSLFVKGISCIMHKRKVHTYLLWSLLLGMMIIVLGTVQGIIGYPHIAYIYASCAGYVYVMTVLIAEILDTLGDIMERAEDAIVLEKIPVKKSMIKERTSQVLYIVCPCYNEAESLGGGTFDRLQDLMGELTAAGLCSPKSRILMVNDGSTDQTAELLEQRHRENPLFSYINLSRNFGHQYALLCGLMNARKYADVTITIDADLQQDINAIRDFLEKYYEGYEIVYGVRKSRKSDGVFKKWSACLFYDIIGKLSGYKIIKNHADYRLMSRKAMDVLAEFGETNLFLRGLIPMIGFPSCIVYFDVQPRKFGESKYNLQKMFRLAIDGVTSLSIRPIRWVFLCGTLMFAVSLLVMGGYLIAFLQGKSISGYTSIIMSLWLIGGMLMMSIGCVGEYIGKLYFETKKRPRYIVEEIQNDTEFEYIGREKVQEEEKRCIICGGRLVTSRLPGLVACEECNFITTDLNLSVEEIRRLYSSGYYNGEEYADYVRDKAIIQKNFRRRLRRIERYLDVPKEKKLFEIGCAYGFFLQVAGERFGKVSGIDIADDAVKYASEELSLEAYAGDYLAFQDKDVYDIICMWDTIEHLSAPDKYIEKAHKCLKQGGLLCITTGDIGSINAKIRGAKWRQIHPPTHLHYFSKETLKNLLEKKGFQVLEVSYPANELSFNTILYTILCLKSNHEKLYGVLARMGITKWNIKMNMRDFMFVIAKKEKSGREHHDSI